MDRVDRFTFTSRDRTFYLSPAVAAGIRRHLHSGGEGERRGVLFGSPGADCDITEFRRMEPDAPQGQSLEDIARFCRLLHDPPMGESTEPLEAVGWYVSLGRGAMAMSEKDRQLHTMLFGEGDLVLLCQRKPDGEVRFAPGSELEKGGSPRWSGWAGPAAAAAIFAVLCITAALTFRPPVDHTDTSPRSVPIQPLPTQSGEIQQGPVIQENAGKQDSDLSFEMARNKRLEATLRILRERAAHTRTRGAEKTSRSK